MLRIAEQPDRRGQEVELRPFFAGILSLLGATRHLRFAAPVDARHLLGAEPEGRAKAVHRGVAAANDGHALADLDRCRMRSGSFSAGTLARTRKSMAQ